MIYYQTENIKKVMFNGVKLTKIFYEDSHITCLHPGDQEVFYNPDFDCGTDYWIVNGYGGDFVDNGDGTVTLTAVSDSSYSSIEQPHRLPLEAGTYLATMDITNLSNNAKFSYEANGSWNNVIEPQTTPGLYKKLFDSAYEVTNVDIGHSLGNTGDYITFNRVSLMKYIETQSPCMTGYDTPYGHVEASHEYPGPYYAWKGMNCTASGGPDAWLTPLWQHDEEGIPDIANGEVWFEWYLTDDDFAAGAPLMYPTKITIKPRASMDSSWYSDNNPWRMRIIGINADMTEEELIAEYHTDNWTGNGTREIDLTNLSNGLKRGIRVEIIGTRKYDNGGSFHTGWAWIKMEGAY